MYLCNVKWITVILAIGILMLNVTPLTDLFVAQTCVEKTSCCSGAANEAENEKDCSRDVCNPFLSCCAPVLISPQVDEINVSIDQAKIEHKTFYRSMVGTLIECEVWQPPELVA